MVADQGLTAAPRIADSDTSEVYYIFTDASFNSETKSGGIGGVLVNGNATVEQWFGDTVTKEFCKSFMAEEQKQAIGELVRVLCSVGGASPLGKNAGLQNVAWYARVPTECNLADFPSRAAPREMLPEALRARVPSVEDMWSDKSGL